MYLGWKQSGQDASEMIVKTDEIKKQSADKEVEVREAWAELKSKLEVVGNLVHDSVPVSDDEVCDFAQLVYLLVS